MWWGGVEWELLAVASGGGGVGVGGSGMWSGAVGVASSCMWCGGIGVVSSGMWWLEWDLPAVACGGMQWHVVWAESGLPIDFAVAGRFLFL